MSEMVDVISSEFEDALEVKNPKSLHRGIFLLLSSTVPREEYSLEHSGLKASIELIGHHMEEGFMRMDEQFKRMDERFVVVDKKFEAVQQQMDKRFEVVDKKFEVVQQQMDRRFDASDKHFESIENRLDKLNQQMYRFMIWSFGTTATASGLIIAVLKLT